MSDSRDGRQLMYCPRCGQHWAVDMLMGDRLPTHMGCDQALASCGVVAHAVSTVDDHRTGPSANGTSLRELVAMGRP